MNKMIQVYRAAVKNGTKREGRALGRRGICEGAIVTQAGDKDGPLHRVTGSPSEWHWYHGKVFDKLGHLLYVEVYGAFATTRVADKVMDAGPQCKGHSPARHSKPYEECHGISHGG